MTRSLSTHVLDTERGEPARGVRVELFRGNDLVSAQETNEDGRIADLADGSLERGVYRLVFHPPSPFFRRVELELAIDDAGRHHHVPLLVSPYACATYRGS
ncbi:MAG: hydroxyisourate hydrolase [Actinomycetota bacterium]|nr:hydroxyisourate hydrolase [Actinomycetota bacterium]